MVVNNFFCEVKMKNDTKPCMLHLSMQADEVIERLRFEEIYKPQGRKAPTRSDFVEDAINFYAKHLEAQLDGQRA